MWRQPLARDSGDLPNSSQEDPIALSSPEWFVAGVICVVVEPAPATDRRTPNVSRRCS
jgi:hypothetical protein